ncbi:hypothetical protein BDR26DRAFT_874811 [Obelidium mucronatum]|nr:hypothetical protein BDR26DRAFT_874811 [Obelidium mucronatum]
MAERHPEPAPIVSNGCARPSSSGQVAPAGNERADGMPDCCESLVLEKYRQEAIHLSHRDSAWQRDIQNPPRSFPPIVSSGCARPSSSGQVAPAGNERADGMPDCCESLVLEKYRQGAINLSHRDSAWQRDIQNPPRSFPVVALVPVVLVR